MKKIDILVFILLVLVCVALLLFILNKLSVNFGRQEWCDYDSCSQMEYTWNYSGKSCWDKNNPNCTDFLRMWNVCQAHKEHLGVC